jgi:hypothetical protein
MRRTNYTIALVGEGAGDCQLTVHIRDLYLPRFCGIALTIKNARGFGGRHALKLALELKSVGAHDAYGVMVDTDRLWDDQDRRLASRAGIVVIENDPSLEATLLRIDGCAVARTTADNKRIFADRFGGPAHRPGVIKRHFDRAKIDSARSGVTALDALLRLLRCP